jgi:hypothetical protein
VTLYGDLNPLGQAPVQVMPRHFQNIASFWFLTAIAKDLASTLFALINKAFKING